MQSWSAHILSSPQRLAREISSEIMATEDEIAEAIEAAIKFEREACAKIADGEVKGPPTDVGRSMDFVARSIAQLIRNR